MSNRYRLTIKPQSSWMSELTADMLFGHLCRQIAFDKGDEFLEKFLSEMEISPIFTISNLLPAGMLPRPLSTIDGKFRNLYKKDTQKNKDYKSIKYVKYDDFAKMYLSKDRENNLRDIKYKLNPDKLKDGDISFKSVNKNFVDRATATTLENAIFSQEEQVSSNIYNRFNLLLKRHRDVDFISLDNVQRYFVNIFESYGVGAKKSTGKGVFQIVKNREKTEILEDNNGKNLLLLSSFIPKQSDPTTGAYSTYTKFGKLGESFSMAGQNFYKKPLIFVNEGACFIDNTGLDYLGRMAGNVTIAKKDKKIYQYAYGCVLRF